MVGATVAVGVNVFVGVEVRRRSVAVAVGV
jgi:hypothetical protein